MMKRLKKQRKVGKEKAIMAKIIMNMNLVRPSIREMA